MIRKDMNLIIVNVACHSQENARNAALHFEGK